MAPNNAQDWFRPWNNERSPSGLSDLTSNLSVSSMPSPPLASSYGHSPLSPPSSTSSPSPPNVDHYGPVFDAAQLPLFPASSNVRLSPPYIQHAYQYADPAAVVAAAINYQHSYAVVPPIFPMPLFGQSYQLSPVAAAQNAGAQFAADYQLAHQSLLAQEALAKQHKQSTRPLRPKKHVCSLCHVAFSNRGQLQGHERSHTGERPFSCDEPNCGKAFTRNEELTRHKRIHSGEKPFACDQCPKSFGRRDHLKKHMLTHQPSAGVPMQMQYAPQYPAPYPIQALQYEMNQLAMMMYPHTG